MIVNGNIELRECTNLKSLGKLKEVKNTLICPDNLENLGDLEYVGGNLYLEDCNNLTSLGNLKEVKGYLSCSRNIKDLGDLEYVGKSLFLQKCSNLKSLGKLKEVSGKIYLRDSGITKEYIKENYPQFLNQCIFGKMIDILKKFKYINI